MTFQVLITICCETTVLQIYYHHEHYTAGLSLPLVLPSCLSAPALQHREMDYSIKPHLRNRCAWEIHHHHKHYKADLSLLLVLPSRDETSNSQMIFRRQEAV